MLESLVRMQRGEADAEADGATGQLPRRIGDLLLQGVAVVSEIQWLREQQRQLIAAKPTGHPLGRQGIGDHLPHGPQHVITGGVAVAVVDLLEVVQIDQQQLARGCCAAALCHLLFEIVAAEQAGQFILIGAQLQFALSLH